MARRPTWIDDVVSPRGVTDSALCHQWSIGGDSAVATLPTTWTQRWSVETVGSQSCHGSSGHAIAGPDGSISHRRGGR